MRERLNLPFLGGMDQSIVPLRAKRETFYRLENFKHSPTQFGKLVQTEYFRLSSTLNRGTYWDGAAPATEPAASALRLIAPASAIAVTDYCVSFGGTQLQVLYQTTVPVAETIYTGLRLKVNSITGLGITLGSTLDVEMTGAATFRWRKNGGGWTAGLVPAVTGVSIDGGNATLYFLANSGFAGTETWAWTRTDCTYDSLANVYARPLQHVFYKNIFYFTNNNTRVMMVENSTTGQYCISHGYRPVYGTFLTVFQDHMIVGGFSKTSVDFWGSTRVKTIGWSDVGDIHNFIPTDLNEADEFTFQGDLVFDTIDPYTPTCWIVGVAVLQQQLFVISLDGIYVTDYLGLPVVFSFRRFAPYPMGNGFAPVIPAPLGVYLVTRNDVVFFNGATFSSIGFPIMNNTAGIVSPVFGYYDVYPDELILVEYGTLHCYQARFGTWYTRSADLSNDIYPVTCISASNSVYLGGVSRNTYHDYGVFSGYAPAYDYNDGTAWATPKITTQLIGENLATMKEIDSVYLGASVVSAHATYFSTAANLQFKFYWYVSTDGLITGSPTSDTLAVWVNSSTDGMVPLPRLPFRAIALELQLVGLVGGKPPGQAVVTTIEPMIRRASAPSVEK